MDWVRNALAALAVELAEAEAKAIEKRDKHDKANADLIAAEARVSDLESARTHLRALLDPSEREVPL